MKNNNKWRWLVISFSAVYSITAGAHDAGGTLGVSASATDIWQVYCSDDGHGAPYQLDFEVKSVIPSSPPVSAQVINDDLAMSTTDRVGGDVNASPELLVVKPGENDTYTMIVNKSGTGIAKYSLQFHCQSQKGDHTGTDYTPVPVQDQ